MEAFVTVFYVPAFVAAAAVTFVVVVVHQTFKMKFGNRGMNQPCIDMRTAKCYITPQNHG